MNFKEFLKSIPKGRMVLLLLAMIIAGFDGVVMSQVIASVTKFNSSSSIQDIISLVIYGLIAYFLVQLASMMVDFLNNNIINYLNKKYKMAALSAICSVEGLKKDAGDTISILTVDLNVIEEKYFAVILGSAYYLLMGLVSLLYLVYLSPTVSILFIIFSFLPTLPSVIFSKYLERATDKNLKKNNYFIKNIKDLTQGYSEIFTYGSRSVFLKRTKSILKEMEDSTELLRDKHAVVGFVVAFLSWISYLAPISAALFLVVNGKLEASVVIALFLASDRVITPFRNFSEYLRMLNSTGSTRKKISQLIADGQKEKHKDNTILNHPDIILDSISFGFKENIFSDFSAVIPFGSRVLITGPSGSGKSTFLDLIQGSIKVNQGHITFCDGKHKIENSSQLVSRIHQEPYYFEISLRDNIFMGMQTDENSEKEIYTILESLGLIDELGSDCLNNLYGEQGERLSGGQKQRIEIARALAHNKKILLVDEGTSSVDRKMSDSIRKILFSQDITILEVAHHYDDKSISKFYTHRLEISNGQVNFYKL